MYDCVGDDEQLPCWPVRDCAICFWQGGYEKGLNKFIKELLVMEKEGIAMTWSNSFASQTGINVD